MRSEASTVELPIAVRFPVWRQVFAAVGYLYCRTFHRSISRPVAGKYHCWECLREFDMDW